MPHPKFRGSDYVTVLSPTTKRDRHGDRAGGPNAFEERRVGPCSISYTTAWAPPKEVSKFPVAAVDRDVTLYFDMDPEITMNDFIVTDRTPYRYRVIVSDTYYKRSDGSIMGTAVRIAALETERDPE